ncbi:MAG: hypothetical protein C5B43_01190 [Verrucomicrobia bacterium]|nr:MAG: hypothetical protein C5B43_01190 [Verrucomicrobiota bacterium]
MGMFVFVLVVGKIIRDGQDILLIGKVSPLMLGELLVMLILYVINYALPLGFLTAILLVLGRLSAQREIIAMKTCGISIYRIAIPVLILGIIGTCLSTFVNAYYAPYAKTKYLQDLRKVLQEDPLQYIRERVFIKDFPGYIIYIGKKEKNELHNIWLWEVDGEGSIRNFIKAKKGQFGFDPKAGDVLLTLSEGTGEMRDARNLENFQESAIPILTYDSFSLRLPFGNLFAQKSTQSKKLSTMTVFELFDYKEVLNKSKKSLSKVEKAELAKIDTEIQRKFAMAFSVLALVLIAVPLGIKASRAETYANLGIAVILALIYYGMIILVTWFDEVPKLRPDLLIWIPNLVFIFLGLYLLKKANKN